MFCDLVGSTTLSEKMDPEEYRHLIKHFRDVSTRIVSEWNGYLARYMGDGLLVYFGYPNAEEDDAPRCALCALELTRRLAVDTQVEINRSLAAKIGIATGTVIAGDLIGTGSSRESVITGFAANLAARLQEIAAPNTIAISDSTYRLIRKDIECEDLGEHSLKGLSNPQRVWQVLRERPLETRFDATSIDALTPFVNRTQEINLLLAAWHRANLNAAQVAIVSGDAGIGKSRLVAMFCEQIRECSPSVLRFQCSPYHTATPLYPVARHLRFACGLTKTEPAHLQLRKLESIVANQRSDPAVSVPILASLLSIPIGENYRPLQITPKRQRELTFEALLNQLADLATRTPVLCIIEDTQWIDPTTAELLELFVKTANNQRNMLLLTGRWPGSWVPADTRHDACTFIDLKGLNTRDSRTLVLGALKRRPILRSIEDRIIEKADGNPLFLEELARQAVLFVHDHAMDGSGERQVKDIPPRIAIPDSIADALMARIDRSQDAKELLEICAVLAREATAELLSCVSMRRGEELHALLVRLMELGLLRAQGIPSRPSYVFVHSILREVVYGSLLADRRKLLHDAVGAAIETTSPEIAQYEPETIAVHYLEAGNGSRAIPYVLAAGQRAIERCAHEEALHFLERGLNCVESSPKTGVRDQSEFELRCMLARVHIFRSSWAAREVEEQYSRALTLSQGFQNTSTRIPVLWGLATSNLLKGKIRNAVAGGKALLTIANSVADTDAISAAHSALTIFKFHSGDFRAVIKHMEKALSTYRPIAIAKFYLQYGTDRKGQALRGGSLAHWCLGDTRRGIELDCEQRELAFSRENSYEIAYSLGISCILYSLHRDTRSVIGFAERAIRLARQEGFTFRAIRAEIFLQLARTSEQPTCMGLQQCTKLIETYIAAGNQMGLSAWLAQLGELWMQIGKLECARDCIERGVSYVRRSGERFAEAELHRVRGNLLLAEGNVALAEKSIDRAIAVALKQRAKSWELRAKLSLAKMLARTDRHARAREILHPILAAFSQQPTSPDLLEARAELDA